MKPMRDPDHTEAARALERFLRADPEQWDRAAPLVLAAVGEERLRAIVTATKHQVGKVDKVVDTPDGLVVNGQDGQVLAFAQADEAGTLVHLRIAPGPYRPPRFRIPPGWRGAAGWIIWCLLLSARIGSCWSAPSVSAWAADVIVVGAAYVVLEGLFTPARLPWWIRRPVEAGALVALLSAGRLPQLPAGRAHMDLAVSLALLTACTGYLLWARRYRWGTPLSAPLHFPLREGKWLIVQGGGPGLNHHRSQPEQRGALDVIAIGARGARLRSDTSPDSYRIYGAELYAPCDGDVVSAVDGYGDQVPGAARYEPRTATMCSSIRAVSW